MSTALTSCTKLLEGSVYFWEPPTAKRLSEILYELGQNDDLRIKLENEGIEAVRKEFNWSIEEKKLLQAYTRI